VRSLRRENYFETGGWKVWGGTLKNGRTDIADGHRVGRDHVHVDNNRKHCEREREYYYYYYYCSNGNIFPTVVSPCDFHVLGPMKNESAKIPPAHTARTMNWMMPRTRPVFTNWTGIFPTRRFQIRTEMRKVRELISRLCGKINYYMCTF